MSSVFFPWLVSEEILDRLTKGVADCNRACAGRVCTDAAIDSCVCGNLCSMN